MNGTRTGPAAPARPRQAVVTTAAVICGLSMLGLGLWAFLDPRSFSDFIDFAPYNLHLIHDAGAFQVGIGAAVLLALWWSDALTVALTVVALIALYLHGRKP